MGNNRFRLSDMIPNAWFYKLKGLSKSTRNHITKGGKHQQPSSSSSSSSTASSFISSSSSSSYNKTGHFFQQRKSYYFRRDLISTPPSPTSCSASNAAHVSQPPAKETSSKKKRMTSSTAMRNRPASMTSDHKPHSQSQLLVSSSSTAFVLTGCSCRPSATIDSTTPEVLYPNSAIDYDNESIVPEISSSGNLTTLSPDTLDDGMLSRSSSVSCSCKVDNVENNPPPAAPVRSSSKLNDAKQPGKQLDWFVSVSDEFHLPPIKTNIDDRKFCTANNTLGTMTSPPGTTTCRRLSAATNLAGGGCVVGLKLRTNSPRIGNKKINNVRMGMGRRRRRRGLSESFAVVKASKDPKRDFRESMVEMIVENNIRASRDLEDLLACYLSLNSNQYHELIIGVFRQIWFDLLDLK